MGLLVSSANVTWQLCGTSCQLCMYDVFTCGSSCQLCQYDMVVMRDFLPALPVSAMSVNGAMGETGRGPLRRALFRMGAFMSPHACSALERFMWPDAMGELRDSIGGLYQQHHDFLVTLLRFPGRSRGNQHVVTHVHGWQIRTARRLLDVF